MHFGATKSWHGLEMPEGGKTDKETKLMLNTKSVCHSLMITNVPNLTDLLKHLFKITEKSC